MIRFKYAISVLAILISVGTFAQNTLSINNLKCDSKTNPLGIGVTKPHLSWEIQSKARDVRQTAYHILVSESPENLKNNIGNIWDSKIANSGQSIQVEYAGTPLSSGKKYFWKVKVQDQSGKQSDWSPVSSWLLSLAPHQLLCKIFLRCRPHTHAPSQPQQRAIT